MELTHNQSQKILNLGRMNVCYDPIMNYDMKEEYFRKESNKGKRRTVKKMRGRKSLNRRRGKREEY